MTYAIETDIEGILGYSVAATGTRPTTAELAIMLTQADAFINAEIRESTNITDTYGILKAVAIGLVYRMINNLFYLAEPDNYNHMDIELSDPEIRLIRLAHSDWAAESWELGE